MIKKLKIFKLFLVSIFLFFITLYFIQVFASTNTETKFVIKINDHTSGSPPNDYILSNNSADSPNISLPNNLNTQENADNFKIKGHWPVPVSNIGSDYIDFYFGDNTKSDSTIQNISFVINNRIQPNNGSSGISGNVDKNNYDAKLYAKTQTGNYIDLAINKQDLVPNLNDGESGYSSNPELITINLTQDQISQLDFSELVIRYSVAGDHTASHSGTTGLVSYFDYIAINVIYVTDTTPPATPTLVFPPDGSAIKKDLAILDWTDETDENGPVTYNYKSSWLPSGSDGPLNIGSISQINATESVERVFTWQVQACDLYNNCSAWSGPWEITIDSTAPTNPTPSSTTHTVSTYSNQNLINISWNSATDSLSGVDGYFIEWNHLADTLESTITKNLEETFSSYQTTLADGTDWYFHITTVDNAGNWTTTNHLGPFFIDNTAPNSGTLNINSAETYTNSTNVNLTISATDNISGVSKMAFSTDGTTFGTLEDYSTTKTYTISTTEGTHTIYVKFKDNAGNENTTYIASDSIILDTTIPKVVFSINPTNPDGNNEIYISKPSITLTASDNYNVDYIQYQLNSTVGLWTTYSTSVEIPEKTTKFYYKSIDKAGNKSSLGLKNITVDLTAPSGIENVSAYFNSTLNEATVNWENNDSDIFEIKVYKSSSSTVDQSSSNYFGTVDKNTDNINDDHVDRGNTYYYLFVTYDEAGNEGDSVKVKVEIPVKETEQIVVTTETIPAPAIQVVASTTPTETETVEGAKTENLNNENSNKEKVLGINDVNINLDDTNNTSNFNLFKFLLNFLKSYWWLLVLFSPLIFLFKKYIIK